MVDSVDAEQKPHVLQRICSGLSVPILGFITVCIIGTVLHTCLVPHYNNEKCMSPCF